MAEAQQWEYHIEVLGSAFRGVKVEALDAYLNEVGEDSWEVVSVHQPQGSNKLWVTMKRKLTAEARRRRSRLEQGW
jgi:hypothetical protein